jgi:hypothetical protein
MDEDQKRIAAHHGSRLNALRQFPEFKEFLEIAEDMYKAHLERLLVKDDPEARGVCKGIVGLFSKCFDDIRFGEALTKELWEKQVNQK